MSVDSQPNLQPTLTGETILIRPLQSDDWAELYRAASDPLIWEVHPARDRWREEVFRGYFDGAIAPKGAFAFIERATGEIVGSSRYHDYDPAKSEVEIGWTFLIRRLWGGSTNHEIKTLMLEHAFTFVDTVVFWVGETNWRSQRAMEKIGGIRREGLHTRPQAPGASVVFEITKTGFCR
jgi:RimJ/RimL family protein N-acetyltransferase